uniref:hypothetical protein n=1 Tax=Salmonella sp. TaxID=599 RepID=UPI001CD9BA59|nr:hypothetical protein [Salmonella sp.]
MRMRNFSLSVMALFNPSDDGNLLARSMMRLFVVLREIGDTATASLLTADGRPTKQHRSHPECNFLPKRTGMKRSGWCRKSQIRNA